MIIPDLGAILAHNQSAHFDKNGDRYAPPRRQYAFNGALSQSDGLLANSVSRGEGLCYDRANEIVAQGVIEFKQSLRKHTVMPLGRIGMMRYDEQSDTLTFAPFAYDCLSIGKSYLPEVRACEVQAEPVPYAEPEQPVAPVSFRPRWQRAARIAASLLLLVGICLVVSTPITVDNAALASLNPHLSHVEPAESVVEAIDDDNLVAVAYTDSRESIISDEPALTLDEAHYLLVIGSFFRQSDAELYIQQLGDNALRIYNANGKYRIYTSAHGTKEDAYAQLPLTLQRYPDAWVCNK